MNTDHLALSAIVAIADCLLLAWFLQPVKKSARPARQSVFAMVGFGLLLMVFGMGYRPLFYVENALILILYLYAATKCLTNQPAANRLLIASLFIVEMRLSSQLIIFANALANGTYITVIESNLGLHAILEASTAALFAISLYVSRKWLMESRNLVPSRLDIAATAALALMSIMLQVINIPYIDASKAGAALDYRAIFMFCALIFYFGVLVLIAGISAQKKIARLETARLSDRLNQEFYRKKQKSDEKIRCMHHDMKNHFACIASMSDSEDVRAYIDAIQKELDRTPTHHTGNSVLDVVLSDKVAEAERVGVTLRFYLDFSQGGFISGPDLCVLFGNSLDNAIEAAKDVAEPDKRIVIVKSLFASGSQIVKVVNHFVEEPHVRHARPISTKGAGHGYGFLSMQSCVERYGGSIEYAVEGDEFSLTIIIPRSECGGQAPAIAPA